MTDKELHYKKLQRMYLQSAAINISFFETTTLKIEDAKATVSLKIAPKYFHALGAIHGSVYFKLLDDAAFFAVNSIVTDVFVLTTNFSINIVRPVSNGLITAIGKIKFSSSNLWIAESSLIDSNGREIAFGTGHFARSKVSLTPEIGYVL
jgi:uncharacterized protein (TIGR00369 family)